MTLRQKNPTIWHQLSLIKKNIKNELIFHQQMAHSLTSACTLEFWGSFHANAWAAYPLLLKDSDLTSLGWDQGITSFFAVVSFSVFVFDVILFKGVKITWVQKP